MARQPKYLVQLVVTAIFLLTAIAGAAQNNKYAFDINPSAFYNIPEKNKEPLLNRLEIFLTDIDGDISRSAVVKYKATRDDYDFSFMEGANVHKTYRPLLMVVDKVGYERYLLKIAYYIQDKASIRLPAIVNVLAQKEEGAFFFYPAIYYYASLLKTHVEGNIKYRYNRSLNLALCRKMNTLNTQIANKMGIAPIQFTYYKFENPKELFKALGFDFTHRMYLDTTGGIISSNAMAIYAGNNSEVYPHEVAHLYIRKICANPNSYANEGLATLIGGSGEIPFKTGIQAITKELLRKQKMDILKSFQADDQVGGKYSMKYFLGALICKKVEDKYGMKGIRKLLCSGSSIDDFLKQTNELIGLNRGNFNDYIMKSVKVN